MFELIGVYSYSFFTCRSLLLLPSNLPSLMALLLVVEAEELVEQVQVQEL